MKRMVQKGVLIVFSALLITFLWYAPAWLRPMFQRDIYREWMESQPPEWQGIVHVWILYDGETRLDSDWLRTAFRRYEKLHPGVYIEMASLTPDEAANLQREGKSPDLWVFPDALMPSGAFRDVSFALPLPPVEKKVESDFEFYVDEDGQPIDQPELSEPESIAGSAWISSPHADFAEQARALGTYLADRARGVVE